MSQPPPPPPSAVAPIENLEVKKSVVSPNVPDQMGLEDRESALETFRALLVKIEPNVAARKALDIRLDLDLDSHHGKVFSSNVRSLKTRTSGQSNALHTPPLYAESVCLLLLICPRKRKKRKKRCCPAGVLKSAAHTV